MSELEKLRKELDEHESQRDKYNKKNQRIIKQIYKLDTEPKLKALVGKCFKYRNSYGNEFSNWWLYVKVISYSSQSQNLTTCSIQQTSRDIIEITLKQERYNLSPIDDYLFQNPITSKQFKAQLTKAIKKLEKMKTL